MAATAITAIQSGWLVDGSRTVIGSS